MVKVQKNDRLSIWYLLKKSVLFKFCVSVCRSMLCACICREKLQSAGWRLNFRGGGRDLSRACTPTTLRPPLFPFSPGCMYVCVCGRGEKSEWRNSYFLLYAPALAYKKRKAAGFCVTHKMGLGGLARYFSTEEENMQWKITQSSAQDARLGRRLKPRRANTFAS